MNHIRPHRLFTLVRSENYHSRMARIVMPDKDTPSLLDTAILLSLARLIQPRNFFEFGTFLGVQTLNMAANIESAARIYTLDLDERSSGTVQQQAEDAVLTVKHLANENRLAFLGTPYEAKIERLFGNSNRFDFTSYHRQMDLIYIDGGHDAETLENDTNNSFAMLSADRPACVAWHDYGNRAYPQVQTYLDELSKSRAIFHVQESWLCFHLQNAPSEILEHLDAP